MSNASFYQLGDSVAVLLLIPNSQGCFLLQKLYELIAYGRVALGCAEFRRRLARHHQSMPPKSHRGPHWTAQEAPQSGPEPPGVAQGPSEGPLEGLKTTKNAVLSTIFGFSAKRDFRALKAPRRAPERPKGRASKSQFEAFWTQFRAMSAAASRQSSSPSSRGLGRATQDGPTEVQKKLSKKAFQKVFQATCRPDVQSTCPTCCSSRPATVERLISRSATIDTTDDA